MELLHTPPRIQVLMFAVFMANVAVFMSMLFVNHSKAGAAEVVLGTIVLVYSLYFFGFRWVCNRDIEGATYLQMTALINLFLLFMLVSILLGGTQHTI